jgi:hypothetical protein
MADKIHCDTHGECQQAFVCSHLVKDAVGLGFNRNEPSAEDPFPDAWCDDCELIRASHDGWNEQSESLVKISLLCSRCYERTRIRNTRTTVTLADLSDFRWKCGSCEEWHTGPCLDFGYNEPAYWNKDHEEANRRRELAPDWTKKRPKTFLTEDICAINDQHFFVRGIIQLPILGTTEHFCWGVWGSLSRTSFEELLGKFDDPERDKLPPMFSWLSNRIREYPDTLNLKMYARIQAPDERPHFELEPTDHPLALEFHQGMSPERVREIMLARLGSRS